MRNPPGSQKITKIVKSETFLKSRKCHYYGAIQYFRMMAAHEIVTIELKIFGI